jgi:hypothetical protein
LVEGDVKLRGSLTFETVFSTLSVTLGRSLLVGERGKEEGKKTPPPRKIEKREEEGEGKRRKRCDFKR